MTSEGTAEETAENEEPTGATGATGTKGATGATGTKGTVRLLLAEDQVMIREALAALLSFEGEFEVVAQVGRGDEVAAAAQQTHPDVAVLDIEMPGLDGLAAAAELKKIHPETK